MSPRPKTNQFQGHTDPFHQVGIPEFHGYVDTRRHGLGLLVECKTRAATPGKGSVVGLAWAIFVVQRSSGDIVGTLQSSDSRMDQGPGPHSTEYLFAGGISQPDYSLRKPEIDRCLTALDGVEFVITDGASLVSKCVAPLLSDLGNLPGADFPEGFPLEDMCDWSGGLSYFCRVRTADQEPRNEAVTKFQAILQALGHTHLQGLALQNLLHGKLRNLVDGQDQRL